jgi:hypothetical protein
VGCCGHGNERNWFHKGREVSSSAEQLLGAQAVLFRVLCYVV